MCMSMTYNNDDDNNNNNIYKTIVFLLLFYIAQHTMQHQVPYKDTHKMYKSLSLHQKQYLYCNILKFQP